MTQETTRHFGPYAVELSNLDKVLFPHAGVTKGDLVDYYVAVADAMLPHMHDRPVVLNRFPDGIGGEGFYQKEIPDYFPSWMGRTNLKLEKGGSESFVVVDKAADLAYLANQAVITPHIWLSEVPKPHYPTKLVFDFDPSEANDLADLRTAVRETRVALEAHGLVPFLMTTGSRGYHVVAPLRPTHTFTTVRRFAQGIARELAERHPDDLTLEMRVAARGRRIFLDYLRNSYGATSVTPYAVRARRGAPVATPLDWDELDSVAPADYTTERVLRRLAQRDDPWTGMERHARELDLA